jgi:type I restriction enzyme M protein
VLFIDASKEFISDKTQNVMDETHISKVLKTRQTRAEIAKYSHRATPEEIKVNDYNLNIPRYVDTFEPEEEINVGGLQMEINAIENELTQVRNRLAVYLKELGIHD